MPVFDFVCPECGFEETICVRWEENPYCPVCEVEMEKKTGWFSYGVE